MTKLTIQEKAIIANHAFAQLLSPQSANESFSELSYCPLQLINDHTLLGHLSSLNPLIKSINKQSKIKVIFTGPHGYISPRWHEEQLVPTWNYASVALTCELNFITEINDKLSAIETLSHYFDPKWDFEEFNQEKNSVLVQQMLSAISVFTLKIIKVNSKFKLSQNRSLACRAAFEKNLRLMGYNELADIQV